MLIFCFLFLFFFALFLYYHYYIPWIVTRPFLVLKIEWGVVVSYFGTNTFVCSVYIASCPFQFITAIWITKTSQKYSWLPINNLGQNAMTLYQRQRQPLLLSPQLSLGQTLCLETLHVHPRSLAVTGYAQS